VGTLIINFIPNTLLSLPVKYIFNCSVLATVAAVRQPKSYQLQ